MNEAPDGNPEMTDVARYAPARVFLAGVGRLLFGGVFLAVAALLLYVYFFARGTLPADRSTQEMIPVLPALGAGFALVALLILPGAIGRMLSAFASGFHFRAGLAGIDVSMPVRRWWGGFRRGIWHIRWDEIETLVHRTSRIGGIPTSTELRIQRTDGKRLRVPRYLFSESVASIQQALLVRRAQWESIAKVEAERKTAESNLKEAQTKLAEARGHEARGDLAAAVAAAEEAVRLDPENPTLRNWLSSFLFAQGRLRESAEALESAIALAPDRALYHGELGNVLLHEGRLLGATTTLRRAVELDPSDAHAHHCLGIALARTGDLAGARAELATLETLDAARAERLRQELPPA
jgi:Flp pilus assembly protein TadD